MTQNELQQLQRQIEALEREQAENDGATKQLMLQLKQLGFDSIDKAKAGVKALNLEVQNLEKERGTLLELYRSNYVDRFSA